MSRPSFYACLAYVVSLPIIFYLNAPSILMVITLLLVLVGGGRVGRKYGAVSFLAFFLVLAAVFHLGLVLPLSLGDFDLPLYVSSVMSSDYFVGALKIIVVGFVGYFLGSELSNRRVGHSGMELALFSKGTFIFWISVALFCACVSFVLGWSAGIFSSPRSVYIELSSSGNLRWFGIFRQGLILSCFMAFAYSGKKYAAYPFWVYALASLPMLLFGKRGEFITVTLAFIIMAREVGFTFSKAKIVLASFFILTISYFLKLKRGSLALSESAFLDPFFEMGLQFRVIEFVYGHIDRGFDGYALGGTYLNGLIYSIPNVAGVHSILLSSPMSPGQWVTDQYGGGAGLGFSVFAEAYMNFGYAGVFFIFFLIPFGANFILGLVRDNRGFLAVFGAFAFSMLWGVRNDSWGVFRPIVWCLCLVFISTILSRATRSKGSN